MSAQTETCPPMNPLATPVYPKKRKGTPHRSPKAITSDSELTAVFIKFPFIAYTHNALDPNSTATTTTTAIKPKKQVRLNLDASSSEPDSTRKFLSERGVAFAAPRLASGSTETSDQSSSSAAAASLSSSSKISIKAHVRFVGDSFHGSNRYWWTRATRPSPALSTSSSDVGSPTGQDDVKDGEYDSSSNVREPSGLDRSPQSAGRGRGGRGRGGRGRGRGGRGRGGWAKKL
ncbi:hypothetical protein BJ741DRAFT_197734 [Chytriomyces cf. hyalinus JEL632]|nr:hypothetical protein BJ741DRAFT_197734 [Chytriomyces cf. hyalinus JEL632]